MFYWHSFFHFMEITVLFEASANKIQEAFELEFRFKKVLMIHTYNVFQIGPRWLFSVRLAKYLIFLKLFYFKRNFII